MCCYQRLVDVETVSLKPVVLVGGHHQLHGYPWRNVTRGGRGGTILPRTPMSRVRTAEAVDACDRDGVTTAA